MSYIRGALLLGRFRSWRDLQAMGREDQRNTLITELAGRTAEPVAALQARSDLDLAGAGALLVVTRLAAIRDDAALHQMTVDDLRNTLITELDPVTGLGRTLQARSDLELVRLALTGSGGVRGVLLVGGFKTWRELNATSADDQRNALIWHLARLCKEEVGFFQGLDDATLAAHAATTVLLRDAGIRDAATLGTMTADDQRNTLIVEIDAFTHEGAALQRFDQHDLVRIALGDDFLLRTSDRPEWHERDAELFLPDIVVRYRGLRCFGETDWDGDDTPAADEPYVAMIVSSIDGTKPVTSRIYDDVDAGEFVDDDIELYRGKARGLGVHIVLGEHDFGRPEDMEHAVEQAADKLAPMLGGALVGVPVVGPALAAAFAWAWSEYGDEAVGWLNDLLDFGDDVLGQTQLFLDARRLRELATAGGHVESPLISGDGASYKARFDVAVAP